MITPGSLLGAMTPQDRAIIGVLQRFLWRQGRIDPDYNGTGNPKVIWDDTPEVVSATQYPCIATYIPRGGDRIFAILAPTAPGVLILGPLSQAVDVSLGQQLFFAGTTDTAIPISAGGKTFTTQSGLIHQPGGRIRLSSRANLNNFIEGVITAYAGTSMTVLVDTAGGAGTFSDWNMNIAGLPGPQGVPGIPGPPGQDGQPGQDGVSPTITVGGTANLPFYANAYVANSGTPQAVVLEFGIPGGPPGSQGVSATVSVGQVDTLAEGSAAYVINTGDQYNAVLRFGIPMGYSGAQGPPGDCFCF